MEINFNLPYLDNGPSPDRRDILILKALLDTVEKLGGNQYLSGRPRVKPYNLRPTSSDSAKVPFYLNGRIVSFNSKNAFEPKASSVNDAVLLRALLEGLISANLGYLDYKSYPELFSTSIYYARTQVWDTIPGLLARGFGDCKSLTAYAIAFMRRQGTQAKPVFRWIQREGGFKDFHILVESELGYEDPSRILGMGNDENAYFQKGFQS